MSGESPNSKRKRAAEKTVTESLCKTQLQGGNDTNTSHIGEKSNMYTDHSRDHIILKSNIVNPYLPMDESLEKRGSLYGSKKLLGTES